MCFVAAFSFATTLAGCGGAGAGAYVDPVLAAQRAEATRLEQEAQAVQAAQAEVQAAAQAKALAVSQLAQYAGTFNVRYSGADSGVCAKVTVDAAGVLSGSCVSSVGNPSFNVTGQVASDGSVTFKLGNGAGTGQFSDVDNGTGTWSSTLGNGSLSITRGAIVVAAPVAPVVAVPVVTTPVPTTPGPTTPVPTTPTVDPRAQYAGTWNASYTGPDRGTCPAVSISATGSISGSCVSAISNPGFSITGQIAADGSATLRLGNGNGVGQFSSTTSGSGTWTSTLGNGTFSISR